MQTNLYCEENSLISTGSKKFLCIISASYLSSFLDIPI